MFRIRALLVILGSTAMHGHQGGRKAQWLEQISGIEACNVIAALAVTPQLLSTGYTTLSSRLSDSPSLGNTDSSCARIWEVAVCRRSPVGGEAQRREHLEAIHLEKAKEEDPWVQLLPFLPRLRKSDAAGAALLPLGWGDLLVSPQQWRWQDLLSQGGSVSSCVAALAPRCCGTRLRRQLVIKLWREVFWVLTFVRSSLQQLTLSCSFSLRWGALHLGTCFSPSAVIREAAADAITELAASRAWARRVPWES